MTRWSNMLVVVLAVVMIKPDGATATRQRRMAISSPVTAYPPAQNGLNMNYPYPAGQMMNNAGGYYPNNGGYNPNNGGYNSNNPAGYNSNNAAGYNPNNGGYNPNNAAPVYDRTHFLKDKPSQVTPPNNGQSAFPRPQSNQQYQRPQSQNSQYRTLDDYDLSTLGNRGSTPHRNMAVPYQVSQYGASYQQYQRPQSQNSPYSTLNEYDLSTLGNRVSNPNGNMAVPYQAAQYGESLPSNGGKWAHVGTALANYMENTDLTQNPVANYLAESISPQSRGFLVIALEKVKNLIEASLGAQSGGFGGYNGGGMNGAGPNGVGYNRRGLNMGESNGAGLNGARGLNGGETMGRGVNGAGVNGDGVNEGGANALRSGLGNAPRAKSISPTNDLDTSFDDASDLEEALQNVESQYAPKNEALSNNGQADRLPH